MKLFAALRVACLALGLLALVESAHAACASPAGNTGDIRYASNYDVMAYCSGAGSWTSMAGGVSVTVNTTGGGGATPAGSTDDIQFNNAGALAADTGNFTYTTSGGLLTVPNISATAISASGQGTFSSLLVNGGATFTGLSSLTTVSASTISVTTLQLGAAGTCASGTAGSVRYNTTSNTVDYCSGSAWLSLGPSATTPVAFLVNKNGADQTITTSTWQKLTFSNKVYDTNNNFVACTTNCASGTQTSGQSRFTATVPGYYFVTLTVECNIANTSGACLPAIYKNGSSVTSFLNRASAATTLTGSTNTLVYLGIGDYLEAQLWMTGTDVDGGASTTNMSGVLLAPQGGGSGGTATPAGSTNDVQFNSSGNLAADTGVFTYASGLLKAPTVSATALDSQYLSATTVYNPGTFSGNTAALNSVSSTAVSASTVSVTTLQLGAAGTCATGTAGSVRYNTTSNTVDYCSGSAWLSLGPSATVVPAFSVNRNGTNQTGIPSATSTKIIWTTKAYDTNNNFSLATGKFTPTIPGKYLITIAAGCPDNTTYCFPAVWKNGVELARVQNNASNGTQASAIVDMNGTTDYVEGYIYNTGGSQMYGTPTITHMDGILISMAGGGSGGTATPAGSTNDVQFNSSGNLAADTGVFTYASGLLKAPTVSATALDSQYLSATTVYNPGTFSGNTAALNSVSSTAVSASTVSVTTLQLGAAGTCATGTAGSVRYNTTSNTVDYCSGSAWLSLGPSATTPVVFQVNKGGTNQTVTTGTVTKVTFPNVMVDTNNNFASSRFTATVPGYYLISLSILCTTNISGGLCVAYIYKNGVLYVNGNANADSTNTSGQATVVMYLAAGDYVEGYGYVNGTTFLGANNQTYMSVDPCNPFIKVLRERPVKRDWDNFLNERRVSP